MLKLRQVMRTKEANPWTMSNLKRDSPTASPVWHNLHYRSEAEHFIWYVVDIVPWLFVAWCSVIDAVFIRNFDAPDQPVGIGRNICHYISAPFVLLAYNVVLFVALHIFAVKGKAVCTHDISAKNNLPPTDDISVAHAPGKLV